MAFHNDMHFSTKDRGDKIACATSYKNGLYLNGSHFSHANGINWLQWKGHYYFMKTSKIMVRRKNWSGVTPRLQITYRVRIPQCCCFFLFIYICIYWLTVFFIINVYFIMFRYTVSSINYKNIACLFRLLTLFCQYNNKTNNCPVSQKLRSLSVNSIASSTCSLCHKTWISQVFL